MNQPPRQTISYLTRRFRSVGLQPDNKLGQNFLIDLNLIEFLATSAQLGPEDVALEVGTGTGSLTGYLSEGAGEVITVEVDGHLHQLARETLEDRNNITFLLCDALKNKNKLNPIVLETIASKLKGHPERRLKLTANLPYAVATPIISNLLLTEHVPHSMTVTIQKELAERIVASPSTKDYSALSIWLQSQCDCEILRILSNKVFWPRPKVESAIIQLRFNPEKRNRIVDLNYFHNFVRALFFHRRKFLRSVLISGFQDHMDKPAVDKILTELQFGPNDRAEELTVERVIPLCESFRKVAPEFKL